MTGYLLLPGAWIKSETTRLWDTYVALVGVAEENQRLREERDRVDRYMAEVRDDLAELARLRRLVGLKAPERWGALATRVLAGRFGPGASLETIMIDRGYATGAAPGTPVVTHLGVVGRVFRASPHVASVLLITDQTFRTAVVTSDGRVPGVIMGGGPRANLEVRYIAPNATVNVGEILVTSGLDETFPKGFPVAQIVSVEPGAETLFQQVQARPLASPDELEEALLLTAPKNWPLNAAAPDALPNGAPAPGPDEKTDGENPAPRAAARQAP